MLGSINLVETTEVISMINQTKMETFSNNKVNSMNNICALNSLASLEYYGAIGTPSIKFSHIEVTRCSNRTYCKYSSEIDEYFQGKVLILAYAYNS